jgi:hypothetical protein
MKYLIRFKVIDHYSDICAPVEQTIIECDFERGEMGLFHEYMDGEPYDVISVEEWLYQ